MKAAVVTPTLSHFEVPLFRLAATLTGLDVCVFHCDKSQDIRYDDQYKCEINRG